MHQFCFNQWENLFYSVFFFGPFFSWRELPKPFCPVRKMHQLLSIDDVHGQWCNAVRNFRMTFWRQSNSAICKSFNILIVIFSGISRLMHRDDGFMMELAVWFLCFATNAGRQMLTVYNTECQHDVTFIWTVGQQGSCFRLDWVLFNCNELACGKLLHLDNGRYLARSRMLHVFIWCTYVEGMLWLFDIHEAWMCALENRRWSTENAGKTQYCGVQGTHISVR